MTSRRSVTGGPFIVPPMGGPLLINKIGTGRFDGYLHRITAVPDKVVAPTLSTEIIPVLAVGEDARYDDYQDYWGRGENIGLIAGQFGFCGMRALSGRGIVDRIYISATATGLSFFSLGWSTTPAGGTIVSPFKTNLLKPAPPTVTVSGLLFSTGTAAGPAFDTLVTGHIPGQTMIQVEGPFVLDAETTNALWLTVVGGTVAQAMRVSFQGRFDAGYRRQMTS